MLDFVYIRRVRGGRSEIHSRMGARSVDGKVGAFPRHMPFLAAVEASPFSGTSLPLFGSHSSSWDGHCVNVHGVRVLGLGSREVHIVCARRGSW